MKVFIQQAITGKYLGKSGNRWVQNATRAWAFTDQVEAIHYAFRKQFNNVQLLLRFESTGTDLVVPLN